jgi:class 3 adenylate cyclase
MLHAHALVVHTNMSSCLSERVIWFAQYALFHAYLQRADIGIEQASSLPTVVTDPDLGSTFKQVKSRRLRVIIVNVMDADLLMRVMQQAKNENARGIGYVYFTGHVPGEEKLTSVNDVFVIQPLLSTLSNPLPVDTQADLSVDLFKASIGEIPPSLEVAYAIFLEDALLAVAYALNTTLTRSARPGEGTFNGAFNGSDMMQSLLQFTTSGAAGAFAFGKDGIVLRPWISSCVLNGTFVPMMYIPKECLDEAASNDSSVKCGVVLKTDTIFPAASLSVLIWEGHTTDVPNDDPSSLSILVESVPAWGWILLAVLLLLLGVTLVSIGRRSAHKRRERQERQEQANNATLLQDALTLLASKKGNETAVVPLDVNPSSGDMVFVFTDIMNSTDAANSDPAAMNRVQQVHDSVLREGIAKFGGYEINTQGDAFEIAFVSVVDAVNFANDVQKRLHLVKWDKAVMAIAAWEKVTTKNGKCMFQGPRIRIGIHVAKPGDWHRQMHQLTRSHIFFGRGYEVGNVIADSANGGQTLLSRGALDCLLPRMRACGFPIIESIGTFMWPGLTLPMELFQVQPMESPGVCYRHFPDPPRKIKLVAPGTFSEHKFCAPHGICC